MSAVALIAEAPRSVQELSTLMALPRTTVIRLLSALAAYRYVERSGPRYRLGAGVLELASRRTGQTDLVSIARPYLQRLVDVTNETATLRVRIGTESAIIAIIESAKAIRFSVALGSTVPLHAGAFAKTLLAFAPPRVSDEVMARPLERLGPRTITEPARLRKELESIRKKGYGESLSEIDGGAYAVAAPLREADGSVSAVIGYAGLASGLSDAQVRKFRRELLAIAAELSRAVGYDADAALTGSLTLKEATT